MRSVLPMKAAKIGYIVLSVLYCVLGILLFALPDLSLTAIGIILGIGMIVFGIVKIIGYFSKDLYRLAFQYDLAFGILLIALGIVTLARPGGAMSFLCIVFGIPVLADGLFKIQISLDAKRFGIEKWWVVLLLAALNFKLVKLDDVKEVGTYLTGIFPLLFVPAAAGVMELWAEMGEMLLPILIAIIPVTVLVMVSAGKTTQALTGRKKKEADNDAAAE